jgi:hypothetical protein
LDETLGKIPLLFQLTPNPSSLLEKWKCCASELFPAYFFTFPASKDRQQALTQLFL